MSSDCNILNPLQRDGTSRQQRLVKALLPAYVSVDERSLADLLVYAHRYAALLRYYRADNTPAGDWVSFIEQDVSTTVALIAATDTGGDRAAFDDLLTEVETAPTAAGQATAFAALFPPIVRRARRIDDWYGDAVEGLALHRALDRLIRSALSDALRNLAAYALRAREVGLPVAAIDTSLFNSAWRLNGVQSDLSLFASSSDLEFAVRRVKTVFETFHEATLNLVSGAGDYMEETLEEYPQHEPHVALFLAFLGVFRHIQDHLNTLTGAHLDFYYRQVLGLDFQAATPDAVHLIFELAKNFQEHLVEAGTAAKAGKDATGVNLFYATDDDLVVNRACLHAEGGLKSIYLLKSDGLVQNIYAAPDADSADGEGGEIENEDGKWETFGGTGMPPARIGIAIASPALLLREGERTITLTFTVDEIPAFISDQIETVETELRHNVTVSLTGEKAWFDVEIDEVVIDKDDDTIAIMLTLGPEVGAVLPFDAKALDDGFDTDLPVIRFVFDNEGYSAAGAFDPDLLLDHEEYEDSAEYEKDDLVSDDEARVYRALDTVTGVVPGTNAAKWSLVGRLTEYDADETYSAAAGDFVRYGDDVYGALGEIDEGYTPPDYSTGAGAVWQKVERSYPYKYFHALKLCSLEIEVEVSGMRSVILENDQGLLNPAKPFQPFGTLPKKGGSFFIGSDELFRKTLAQITLDVTWGDLPDGSFSAHYAGYSAGTLITSNADFKAEFEILHGGAWKEVPCTTPGATTCRLFAKTANDATDAPAAENTFTLDLDTDFERPDELKTFTSFRPTLQYGFVRAVLETSFLHSLYGRLTSEAARNGGTFPNLPYTPVVSGFELGYRAVEKVDFQALTELDFEDRIERLYHLYPFGLAEVCPLETDDDAVDGALASRRLAPSFEVSHEEEGDAEGSLYLGIENLDPEQNLSILFQVAEGSADPTLEPQDVVWSYLADNVWIAFKDTEILSDTSNGLLTSGIIEFVMPDEMTDENTILPSGLHWIKVSVAEDTAAVSRLIAVLPQAVRATFEDQGNDPEHLATPLESETIAKLKTREAPIKSVSQPFASFGGRMKEDDEGFYTRVSERLRHKRRAVTIYDYEHLLLQEFEEVYKVRCINHTHATSEYAPGNVRLIVVPNLRNKNAVDPFRPMVSLNTLEEIEEHLADLASDFVSISVKNPTYEQVQVDFKVSFHKGKDKGYYTRKLEEDVIRHLSPWLYEEGADLSFGGRIHRSHILHYIEQRDYVDFVTDFSMNHITDAKTLEDVEEAVATTSSSVLVSAETHAIGEAVSSCP